MTNSELSYVAGFNWTVLELMFLVCLIEEKTADSRLQNFRKLPLHRVLKTGEKRQMISCLKTGTRRGV